MHVLPPACLFCLLARPHCHGWTLTAQHTFIEDPIILVIQIIQLLLCYKKPTFYTAVLIVKINAHLYNLTLGPIYFLSTG